MKENYEKAIKLMAKYKNVETAIKNAENNEVVEIIKKKTIRNKEKGVISVKQFCQNLIYKKLKEIAKAVPDEGYSMGSRIVIKFNKLICSDDRTNEYSKSCSYRPIHGQINVRLTKDELQHIKVVGGVITYIYSSKQKVKRCWWFEGWGKKQNFHLVKVEGYIFNGFHSKDKNKALEVGTRLLKAEKEAKKEQNKKTGDFKKALRLQYSFYDSLKCGNCEAGTRAFAIRIGLDTTKKYRGSFLLKSATEKSTSSLKYVERMINYKVK